MSETQKQKLSVSCLAKWICRIQEGMIYVSGWQLLCRMNNTISSHQVPNPAILFTLALKPGNMLIYFYPCTDFGATD